MISDTTIILIRRARYVDNENIEKCFSDINNAHPNGIFITGNSPSYKDHLLIAQSFGFNSFTLETETYDPDVVFGASKHDWIMDEYSLRDSTDSLNTIFHKISIEIESLLKNYVDRPLVFYFDQLTIELIFSCLLGNPITSIKKYSLYLDELAIAIIQITSLGQANVVSLVKSNVLSNEAFVKTTALRLV